MIRAVEALVVLAWFGWSVAATVLYLVQRRRMKGLEEPVLWLPRRERREHARKLLRREDEQWIQQMIERQTGYIEKEK